MVRRMSVPNLARRLALLADQISTVIVGKRDRIEDALTCLLAGGHLLIEDLPGVGKTTLAQALAQSLGLRLQRVQFTADLLPTDLLGTSVFERAGERFVFHPGPVFSPVLLADEINRAGPKTQSALLEAMEERQVSIDGVTHPLPEPFFVIATQNPAEQLGTHPLPESQLDRFLMCIHLGYPDPAAERALLAGEDRRALLARLPAQLDAEGLRALRAAVAAVHASDALLDYLQALLTASRQPRWFQQGLSPRAGLAILRAARARALLSGRDWVAPEDLQRVLPPACVHRLHAPVGSGRDTQTQVQALLAAVPLP
ncbi:MAG: hypothetical protein RLY78_2287 [Pseudomonadota bacterium]|jgi:MoxR-like ATPase|uniref:AAA family ATPase n=1 Tax=Pseudaquabacterium rugosum TaxID=2984194 RepID=A0ABU9B8J5_9BURK